MPQSAVQPSPIAPQPSAIELAFDAGYRTGEVATMLGWLYVEQGQTALAKPLFAQGSLDASSRVRTSAQAGLKTIAN
tara:strand:+ start:204324 stop:204554 length:231 start_codon:yes stop_codon:yes gene_type:complete